MLVSDPDFWQRAPETLVNSEVLRALGASFVLTRQLWSSSWMGVSPETLSNALELGIFSPTHPVLQGGERVKNGVKN